MASDITAPSKNREKVTLKPGFHLSNWIQKLDSFPRPAVPLRKISIEEVRLHNTETDCWTVLNGRVFDITEYVQYHPGIVLNAASILDYFHVSGLCTRRREEADVGSGQRLHRAL